MATEVVIAAEAEEPESKKQKLEEEDDESWRNDEFYAYRSKEGLREINPKELGEYIRHVNESHGFDVPDFPNTLFDGIAPCNAAFSDPWVYGEVHDSAKYAIAERNKLEGKNYVYYRLVKVNREPVAGAMYYITFLAEDLNVAADSGSKVGPNGAPLFELQAQVYYPVPDEERKINMELLYFHAKDTLSEEGLKRC